MTPSTWLLLVLVASLVIVEPARSQNSPGGAAGLPQGSTVIGVLHRAPDGHIIVEQRPDSPSPARPTVAAPPRPAAQTITRPSPQPPPAATPPAEHAVVAVATATGPEAWDKVSCRGISWQPDVTLDTCLHAMKIAREHVASLGSAKAKAEAKHGD